ncbi:MAG: hypothetical protein AB7E09_07205 [Candidatus Izemoplasmatales bacterium]
MNKLDRSIKNLSLKDLVFVLLYGVVLSILFGILIGLVDSLIYASIGFSLAFIFFFLSSRWLGRQIRKLYEIPHFYYVLIAFIGLFIQAVIVLVLQTITTSYDVNIIQYPEIFLNEQIYIEEFLWMLKSTFTGGLFQILNYMITYLLYGVGIYIGLKETY